jgi:putative sugar O-methyltransferase
MKQQLWDFLYRFFPNHGHHLVPSAALYDWQKAPALGRGKVRLDGPEQADQRLRPDNPELRALSERYAAFDKQATTPLFWSNEHITKDSMCHFRGSDIYVSQDCGLNYGLMAMGLTYYQARANDHLGLFEKLEEDADFAASLFEIDGRKVSRDLLDSIAEILFLDREFGLADRPGFTMLDIGAGYGRLAHRMARALPNLGRYLCTDAVPESTFFCRHYVAHRGVQDKVQVIPLDEIEDQLSSERIDLAVNIHSFSECSLEAIDWWIALLARHKVPRLMITPNQKFDGGRTLAVDDGRDFLSVVEKHGYRLDRVVPKYDDPFVMKHGLDPGYFHVFSFVGS